MAIFNSKLQQITRGFFWWFSRPLRI
jgi:hypothetical protein